MARNSCCSSSSPSRQSTSAPKLYHLCLYDLSGAFGASVSELRLELVADCEGELILGDLRDDYDCFVMWIPLPDRAT